MANKKRDPSTYIKKMGRYKVERKDLLALEKILRDYSGPREITDFDNLFVQRSTSSSRRFVNRYVSIGRFRPPSISVGIGHYTRQYAGIDWIDIGTSVRALKEDKYPYRTNMLKLSAWPGIYVSFTPFETTIFAQTHNSTGEELRDLKVVAHKIENYISRLPKSFINTCRLRR